MPLVWLAFFLSGIAGLSYELTWVRYLTHLFGASTPAVSATIAIFFSGLALGSALGGRYFDRSPRPLVSYGLLEAAIGGAAALVPLLFGLADRFLASRGAEDAAGPLLLLGLATTILLIPTILLGATFPAMAAVVRHLRNPTGSTGLFYGLNTLGAMVGCLVVSFFFMEILGPARTTWAMAGINLTIAGLMITLGRRPLDGNADKAEESATEQQKHLIPPDGQGLPSWLALTIAAGSGLFSIGIEVLLTRALALVFTATVYVFAITLSAYLVGIGVGSLLVGYYHRRRPPRGYALCILLLLVTLGNVLSLRLLPELPAISYFLYSGGYITSWASNLVGTAGMALLSLLPATIMMGATLPLLVGLATADLEAAGQSAGKLYAINTVSGVVGSLMTTFLLMPWLGVSRSLLLLAIGYVALALVVTRVVQVSKMLTLAVAVVLVVGFSAAALGFGPEVNVLQSRPGTKLVYFRDAAAGTVAVKDNEKGERSLWINNFQTLSDTRPPTVEMQYSLGHLPLLLHPNPKRALLVGFATGTTMAAMVEHESAQVDAVELHDVLPTLAPLFTPYNLDVHKNPRARVIIDDGRRYIARRGQGYDVIVGDLYFPRDVGVGALYSEEHFTAARERLSDGGIVVIWLPLSQLSPLETGAVIRSFLTAFPEAEGWIGWWTPLSPSLGLVGVKPGSRLTPPSDLETRLQARLASSLKKGLPMLPSHVAESAAWIKKHPGDAKAEHTRRLLSTEMLRRWAEGAPRNTLEHPIIEYMAPRSILEQRLYNNPLALQNLRKIATLRDLRETPWNEVIDALGIK